MKHRALDEVYCSVARTWSVLGDRWTMLVLREAFAGTSRFDGFQAKLEIGRTLLSERLNRLVDEGIFDREIQEITDKQDQALRSTDPEREQQGTEEGTAPADQDLTTPELVEAPPHSQYRATCADAPARLVRPVFGVSSTERHNT